ncbi:MAG: tRNA pseudouridine(38-40) synthase TruA [Acidimicrobiales bacterium]
MRVRATVAYDGSGFSGFAVQPGGRRTVAGALTDAFAKVLGHPLVLTGAGRTDAGVHARGQVVSFDADPGRLDVERLRRSVTKLLAPAITVRDLAVAPEGFDARFSATARRYRYTVLATPTPDPFLATTAWWVEQAVDLDLLRLACDPLIGEHDFSAFCRRPKVAAGETERSLVRTVRDARWECETHDDGRVLRFWIEADAFCHQMVRSIVGTLVEVGTGRRRAGELAAVLRGRSRVAAGVVAPPHGLCLWSVSYEQSDR